MGLFFAVLLRALHFFYAATLAVKLFWKRQTGVSPQPLTASRRRLPKHLAIVFAVDPSLQEEVAQDVLTESVVDAVTWCQAIGVQKLTIYEERGAFHRCPWLPVELTGPRADLLSNCVLTIRDRLHVQSGEDCSTGSETEYPLTPPPSDYAESRPLSPDFRSEESTFRITTIRVGASPCGDELRKSSPTLRKHRKQREATLFLSSGPYLTCLSGTSGDSDISDILVCFASRESAKPAIANVAQDLARNERSRKSSPAYADGPFEISVPELGRLLEGTLHHPLLDITNSIVFFK